MEQHPSLLLIVVTAVVAALFVSLDTEVPAAPIPPAAASAAEKACYRGIKPVDLTLDLCLRSSWRQLP